ncbi:MAG: biotin--[acetyl-CoA-carboxylase] ligase [Candidatus Rokubacteria bacterium]|nr:biotin--[acetyl-CoA-carboxylase] ligase [Candidatus Rokubacteria bacterium]
MRPATTAREPQALHWVLRELDTVDSTQAELLRLTVAGAREGTAVTAQHQTAGRGRRSRAWWDTPGESLLVSALLRPPIAPGLAPQLTLVAAVAVVDAVRAAAGVEARIRWPNDVTADGRKLGGILAEASSGPDGGLQHVLLGIGINVNQTAFPPELAERATSLRLLTGARQERALLLARLLEALARRYEEYLTAGFEPVRGAWRAASATLGTRVVMPDGRSGMAEELDGDGALRLRLDDGTLARVSSGEIADAPPP